MREEQKREALVQAAKVAFLGDMVAGPARVALGKSILDPKVDEQVFKRLEQKALKEMPHLHGGIRQDSSVLGGHYNPFSKEVVTQAMDPEVLAHELGHAEIDRSALGKLVQNPVTTLMGNAGSQAGFAGGIYSGYQDEKSGDSHKLRDGALLAGIHAPQLGYEAAATLKGRRMLQEAGVKDLSSYNNRLGRAWGTYAMNPVAAGLNYGLGRVLGSRAARGDKAKTKQADLKTIGLAVGDIAPRVDIMKHLSGAAGKGVDDLAHYYKNMHLSPSHAAGQAQLAHAAQATAAPARAAQAVATKTPTMGVGHGVQALQGIQNAVQTGAPARATPETLSALMQMPGHALGFGGKYAGLANREYMRRGAEAAGKMKDKAKDFATPQNALRYGLPGVLGGLSGAERVPENRLVGAVAGAGGAIGGAELGGWAGKGIAKSMGADQFGETLGSLIGRVIGQGVGTDVGVRGARLAVG
jgi:hypothetical protein